MARTCLSWNFVLGVAAVFFLVIQVRLFQTQTEYVDQIASAMKRDSDCTERIRELVDGLAASQGNLSSLEDQKTQLELRVHELSALVEDHEKKDVSKISKYGKGNPVAAVVIMACNRPDYLARTIKSVLRFHGPVAAKFPLFISQDGSDSGVESLSKSSNEFSFMQHLDFKEPTPRPADHLLAYFKIASHYKWALSQLFRKFPRVIILEDDMEISRDFFDYFEATSELLDEDRTLMAVSSWNDNGQKQFVQDPKKLSKTVMRIPGDKCQPYGYVPFKYIKERLYRSDFFPGLGWMLNRQIWDELAPKWPQAYWDDWMRLGTTRHGRQFIRPEICRTYNFGEHGASMGQFFKQYLEPIKLNDVKVNWKIMDLTYLLEPDYSVDFEAAVNEAMPISLEGAVEEASKVDGDVRIEYNNQDTFERLAGQFGIFKEWKDGVARTAYRGVVVFRWQGHRRVFLVSSGSRISTGRFL